MKQRLLLLVAMALTCRTLAFSGRAHEEPSEGVFARIESAGFHGGTEIIRRTIDNELLECFRQTIAEKRRRTPSFQKAVFAWVHDKAPIPKPVRGQAAAVRGWWFSLFGRAEAAKDNGSRCTATSVTGGLAISSLYPGFAAVATASVVVPGLEEGLIPQGLAWLPERNWFLVSGYRSDTSQGILVAVDAADGRIAGQAELRNPDGTAYVGHAGGVAATAGNIVVAGERKLHCLPIPAFPTGSGGGECVFNREIEVPNRASYCFCGDGVFWVGEFRHLGYATDAGHRMEHGGETFQAWLCGYVLCGGELPLDAKGNLPPPDYVLVTPDDVQGASISDGIVWLSRSFGRGNDSSLDAFHWQPADPPDGRVKIGDAEVRAWFLGKQRRMGTLTAPPMSENLCRMGDDVCVLFESGAKEKRGKSGKKRPVDRLFRFPNRLWRE